MNREAEEFRISSDIKQANLEILRGRLEQAEALISEISSEADSFTARTGQLVKGWPERAKAFLASQQVEQATMAKSSMAQSEQAEDAQGEREALPYWEPCNPACDPELNGFRDRRCHCAQARAALAQGE